jgi:hypothetical protein
LLEPAQLSLNLEALMSRFRVTVEALAEEQKAHIASRPMW